MISKVFIDGSTNYISASAAIFTRQTLNSFALPLLDATRELLHRLFFSYFWFCCYFWFCFHGFSLLYYSNLVVVNIFNLFLSFCCEIWYNDSEMVLTSPHIIPQLNNERQQQMNNFLKKFFDRIDAVRADRTVTEFARDCGINQQTMFKLQQENKSPFYRNSRSNLYHKCGFR